MKLYLYEEIMLLALRDDKGTLVTSFVEYAVAGAVLAELLLENKISISEDSKRKVSLLDMSPIGDPIIDECMEQLSAAKKQFTMQDWVAKLASIKELRHKVARQLCQRGILRADEDKILFIFTKKTYPEINSVPEQKILERMHQAIFCEEQDIDPRTIVLISLAKSAHLLVENFDAKEIKAKKQRIEQIINGDLTGSATREVIAACEMAVIMTAILPAIISTTIVTS